MPNRKSRFRTFHSEAPRVTAEINVTPLVDVVLVLLIIFMIITPMLQTGTAVPLPLAKNPEQIKEKGKQKALFVTLRRNKTGRLEVYIDEDKYADDVNGDVSRLIQKLRDVYQRDPDRKVFIKAARDMTFGEVRVLMKHVQASGFNKVILMVDKPRATS